MTCLLDNSIAHKGRAVILSAARAERREVRGERRIWTAPPGPYGMGGNGSLRILRSRSVAMLPRTAQDDILTG